MTLGEALAARAENARARETVEIGSLGSIMLDALPVRDLERLMRGVDSDRAVFYAACRELQRVGAELLQAGKVSRPDQVVALVSDGEAAKAAEAVRALSGWSGAENTGWKAEDGFPSVQVDGNGARAEKDADTSGQVSHESEIRLDGVQENVEVRQGIVQDGSRTDKVRLALVREKSTEFPEIRQPFVQTEMMRGQDSGEFLAESGEASFSARRPQRLPKETADEPQNVAVSDNTDGGLRNTAEEILSKNVESTDSDAETLHENKSEIGAQKGVRMHESESESADGVHEIKSEQRTKKVENLHESESESTGMMHEIKSESAERLHEGESEQRRKSADEPHETESELTERVARALLDGLRRAAWVR